MNIYVRVECEHVKLSYLEEEGECSRSKQVNKSSAELKLILPVILVHLFLNPDKERYHQKLGVSRMHFR